jgi:hypothetical protein
MPRGDFDVITGPPAPSRPIPPASLPPASNPAPSATPERTSDQSRSDSGQLKLRDNRHLGPSEGRDRRLYI